MTQSGQSMQEERPDQVKLLPPGIIFPFLLLASCFMWWGIANNITDPLVKVFKEIFGELSTFQASLIQFAFYGGYFCMALPGAIIARRFSYKTGVLVGLGLYAVGCFLLYPSTLAQQFVFFCLSYYVLACGLSILETNANPYILAIWSPVDGDQAIELRSGIQSGRFGHRNPYVPDIDHGTVTARCRRESFYSGREGLRSPEYRDLPIPISRGGPCFWYGS